MFKDLDIDNFNDKNYCLIMDREEKESIFEVNDNQLKAEIVTNKETIHSHVDINELIQN